MCCYYQGDALFLDPHTVGIQGEGEGLASKRRRYSLLVARDPLTARHPWTTIALSIQTTLPPGWSAERDHRGWRRCRWSRVRILHGGLGCRCHVIDQRPIVLEFVDREIVEALFFHLRHLGAFPLRRKVRQVGIDAKRDFVFAELGERQESAR